MVSDSVVFPRSSGFAGQAKEPLLFHLSSYASIHYCVDLRGEQFLDLMRHCARTSHDGCKASMDCERLEHLYLRHHGIIQDIQLQGAKNICRHCLELPT